MNGTTEQNETTQQQVLHERVVMLPCPFCGENEDLTAYDHEAICGNCGARVGSFGKPKSVQIKLWNTRAT